MIRSPRASARIGIASIRGLVLVVVASTLLGACANIASTWMAQRSDPAATSGVRDVLLQLAVMIPGFSGVAAIVVLSAVASVAVQSDHERYARWQLIGITPGGVRGVLALQLTFLSLLGGIIGLLIAVVLAQPTIDLVVHAIEAAADTVSPARASTSGTALLAAWAIIVVIVLVSGLAPGRRYPRQPLRRLSYRRLGARTGPSDPSAA